MANESKESKIGRKLFEFSGIWVVFEWYLSGIYEIRGIDVVRSLDLQLFEWYDSNLVEIEVSIFNEISEIL